MSDDPVRIQINFRSKVPKGKKMGAKALQQAIERWAYTGIKSKFVEIRAVHWLNPERMDEDLAVWKVATADDVTPEEYLRMRIAGEVETGDSLEQARRSLRLAEMPTEAFAQIIFVKERRIAERGKRKTKRKKNAAKRKSPVSSVRHPKGKNKR